MKVVRTDSLPMAKSPRGPSIRKPIEEENIAITAIYLEPRAVLPSHKTPVDVTFYIQKGSGNVVVGQSTVEVTEKEFVFSPKNVPHGLRAGDHGMEVLVIKTPNPSGK